MSSREKPLVSVVLAAYNTGALIEPTVNSVLEQTMPDFELIVVDDGSTDDTVERLRSYQDVRFRLIEQEHQGTGIALNACLKVARGEFIAFLDHDDLWVPTKLEKHVDYFRQHPEADMTFSWSRWVNKEGEDIGYYSRRSRGAVSFLELFEDFVVVTPSSVVVRASALNQAGWFDPQFLFLCDLDLCLRIAMLKANNTQAIPEELALYRRHAGQQSTDWQALKKEWVLAVEKFNRLAPRLAPAVIGKASSNMDRYLASLAYEQNRFREALQLLWEGFVCAPARFLMDFRNWKVGVACLVGLLLPLRAHRGLERLAGFRR